MPSCFMISTLFTFKSPRLPIFDMKVVVTLWCGGRTFDEEVIVARLEDADATAIARNPSNGVKVISRRIVVGE